MALTWQCTVPGSPVAQGRPRFARCGRFVRAYTPTRTANWRDAAVRCFKAAFNGAMFDEPIRVFICAVMPRPKRITVAGRAWHGVRPDADNLAKAALDSLKSASVIRDDCLVVHLEVRKLYAARDEEPHLRVSIETTD